jgi:hypothetical protein
MIQKGFQQFGKQVTKGTFIPQFTGYILGAMLWYPKAMAPRCDAKPQAAI